MGMVGYFPPLVEQARANGTRLTVLELDDRWLQEADEEGDEFVVTLNPEDLRQCRSVVCTGTTLINQSIDSVLKHCRGAEQIMMVGPTVGCLPDPLFDRGVTTLGGSRVVDLEMFLKLWAGQQKWRGATKRYALSSGTTYPGFEALVSAAARRRGPP